MNALIFLFFRLCATVAIAFLTGKLIAKIKLPSILGWLITGMVLGPHALSLMNQEILDAQWYQTIVHIFRMCCRSHDWNRTGME